MRAIGADEYGIHVEIERGVEGVIPRGEISADLSQEPTDIVKVGDIVKAQVIRIDDDDRTITLSLRAAEGQDVSDVDRPAEGTEPKRAVPRKVGPSLSGAQATLGDALKDKARQHRRRPDPRRRHRVGTRGVLKDLAISNGCTPTRVICEKTLALSQAARPVVFSVKRATRAVARR